MFIVSYDISDDKLRTKFSKFLKKFGNRMQYSVFRISNSPRVLENIKKEIQYRFEKRFTGSDSIVVFQTCKGCTANTLKFGYAKTEDDDIVFL
ncbi:CRISPR-associated endonuclease Cas2 [Candidatus Peregrinibacteria bacterium CG_4_9_14_0_2_um_filter_53_11]|nr:MAG: CRISPR-associated endonuclease Cas2 [Candidatus Peregrinibacteria bacterium CG_4_9_14_0_2_um_filter_53_11]